MNSLGLIYRGFTTPRLPLLVDVPEPQQTLKRFRGAIKPDFPQHPIRYSNPNGREALLFVNRLARCKWDWISFQLESFSPKPDDYPSDEQLIMENLLRATDYSSYAETKSTIEQEIERQNHYLIVKAALVKVNSEKPKQLYALRGLPTHAWPCTFEIRGYVTTNAPSCLHAKYPV